MRWPQPASTRRASMPRCSWHRRSPCRAAACSHACASRSTRAVAYIVGGREFWSLWFEVTPDTLIPRPETEGLVEIALASLAEITRPRILDVGTGSGCIAIAIAGERPDAEIIAIDTSDTALAVARRNAERLGVAARIDFVRADLRHYSPPRRFDLIAANPPYIRRADIDDLQAEVARFEPRAALDGGDDGLDLISALLRRSRELLVPGATMAIEIGADQGDATSAFARASGCEQCEVRPDGAGLPRILVVSNPVSNLPPASPQPPTPSPPCP
jgi:release factor glutamine methyltransferase